MEKILKVFKKIKLKNLIILIFLLLFNTYAWFIYASKVSTGITAHVSSWNVEFSTGLDDSVTNMIVEIDRIYPGMEKFEKIIDVYNKGETAATIDYEFESIRIIDENLEVGENITGQDLENKIKTEYPFKINVKKELLDEGNTIGRFIITLEWPFESGDDEADTVWGNKAYEYYSLNPGKNSIEIGLKLIAKQVEEE